MIQMYYIVMLHDVVRLNMWTCYELCYVYISKETCLLDFLVILLELLENREEIVAHDCIEFGITITRL